MNLQYVSDGFHLDRKDLFGREASVPSWLSTDAQPLFLIDTGDNSAGSGGNGYFAGSMIDSSYAAFEPFNIAQAGAHGAASAHQINVGLFDQSAAQLAGIGGDGGDWNAGMGGSAGLSGSIGSDVIASGDNSAGQGGNGHFSGALVHAPSAVFSPINIAVAGFHGTADSHQSNTAQFLQSASQIAGAGASGGAGNAATGGGMSGSGSQQEAEHKLSGGSSAPASWFDHQVISSDLIASGGNHAGDGGGGYFHGSIVHAAFALYDPVNIAVAGYHSIAQADQTNNVEFNQTALQMAGVGGSGGSGNAAAGGESGLTSSVLGLIGSDVIATGGNSAGIGGHGHFAGSLIDLDIAIYAPINIAIAGPGSTADAHQINNVHFDQSAIQIAGIGGDGGHGNAAFGGDIATHLLADHHMLTHA
jgi:hypothetical protein